MNQTAGSSNRTLYVNLSPGDPAPNPGYALDTAAGRYIVLCFYVTSADAVGRATIQEVLANRKYFDDARVTFLGVSLDRRGEEGRTGENTPGIRFVLDSDWNMSRLYGCMPKDASPGSSQPARRLWIVLDPTLRVLRVIPFAPDGSDTAVLFKYLEQLPPPERFAGIEVQAPILFLPSVFDQGLCQELVRLYEVHGGQESGFWDVVEGRAVALQDSARKRRKDYVIENNPELIRRLQIMLSRRVFPEIKKAYFFEATHIERFMISCYSAEDHGHFRAHRDNTTAATAHRRFAVSINLNSEFEGGEISFPEYGHRSYRPPIGGAVIFSCALLHAVSSVSSGRRYAFLPFLYNEAAARISRGSPTAHVGPHSQSQSQSGN